MNTDHEEVYQNTYHDLLIGFSAERYWRNAILTTILVVRSTHLKSTIHNQLEIKQDNYCL